MKTTFFSPEKRLLFIIIILILNMIGGFQNSALADSIPNTKTNIDSITYKFPRSDGRFTLGVNGKRLMYGYPYAYSTSHFVVKIDNHIASNYAGFGWPSIFAVKKKFWKRMLDKLLLRGNSLYALPSPFQDPNLIYLRDTLKVIGTKKSSLRTTITYKCKGIKITQKLTPLDAELNPVKIGEYGQYYKVEYIFVNTTDTMRNIGLLTLYDTMMDNNDACRMDAFATDDKSFKRIRTKRGYETYFAGQEIPKRVLAYHNATRGKSGLTGDFLTMKKSATPPDEMFIGPWPVYHSVVWDYAPPEVLQRYSDSAILMKWDQQKLSKGDTLRIFIYYGLFNKGKLELIPSNNDLMVASFYADPDSITVGQKSQLKWECSNPLNADVIISTNKKVKQRNKGSMYVSPKMTTPYTLAMIKDGKMISIQPAIVNVFPKKEVVKVEKKDEYVMSDGRFNLGLKNQKSLVFGYPLEYSSSFFVVSANGKYATNYPNLKGANYLLGQKRIDTLDRGNSLVMYDFEGLRIAQSISATDRLLKPTLFSNAGKIKVEYEISNESNGAVDNVGLSNLLDLMVVQNDEAKVFINKRSTGLNKEIQGDSIPNEILIVDDSTKTSLSIYPKMDKSLRPDKITIGSWQHLQELVVNPDFKAKNNVNDCALLMQWSPRYLRAGQKLFAQYFIGPTMKDAVGFNYFNYARSEKISIFFKTNEAKISDKFKTTIDEYITGKTPNCVLIEAFCDSKGDDKYNYDLSKRRNLAIKDYLMQKGIKNNLILQKPNGQFYATSDDKNGQDKDRKAVITFFYKN